MDVVPDTELYFSTDELKSRFKPALTNYFSVYIGGAFGGASNRNINFMAYEAVLPGTSYDLGEVYGDRMGRTEQYPTKRVYPPVDVSFYVDKDYEVIKFFEGWMNSISRNYGSVNNSYVKHNYASSYEREVIITKFERDLRPKNQRLKSAGIYRPPAKNITYTLRNAFPANLISIPVSYDGASVLKTTVTFNYDVYNFQCDRFGTDDGTSEDGSSTGTVIGPGANTQGTAAPGGGTNEGEEIIRGLPSLASQVTELKNMQEASRLRQAGYSPGLGQNSGDLPKSGPGF